MQFSVIRTRCAKRFIDSSNAIISDADWKDYVNARYRRVQQSSSEWPWKTVRSNALTINAGVRYATLPTDTFRVTEVLDYTNANVLRPLDGSTSSGYIDPGETATGSPTWYQVVGNHLEVYPLPDANITLHVRVITASADLSADADLPIFPSEYADILVEGALADAYYDDGQPLAGKQHEDQFVAILANMKTDLLGSQQEMYPQPVDVWYN